MQYDRDIKGTRNIYATLLWQKEALGRHLKFAQN